LFSRAIEHRPGGADFRLANGRLRLDVHDYSMLQVDELIVGIGITGDRVGRSSVAGRRIGWGDHLWLNRRRPAEGRFVQDRQIFRDCATGRRIEVLDLGDASTSVRVRHDDAGVDREGLPPLHRLTLCLKRNHRRNRTAV
jgi:hypothetical protein